MKKFLSVILCSCLLFSSVSTVVYADNSDITVYVSVSQYGKIVNDKNGELVAWTPITISGSDTYSLDDALVKVHDSLYIGGSESGYETAVGDYGLYVTKFWGDTSGNFTYNVNLQMVYGPTHQINNGDYIEFAINKNFYPDTESYTKFDKTLVDLYTGDSLTLNLSRAEFVAEGMAFSPYQDAIISVNGQDTEILTDSDGMAELLFENTGIYVVSAYKSKLIDEQEVPDICAPVCVVKVCEKPAVQMMHNIAKKYFTNNIINDGNMYWFLADYADYIKIYPETDICFSQEQIQSILDKIISDADSSSSQGDLAKCIIALRALGYDAKNTYTKEGVLLNIPSKLESLITPESMSAPYYEYTLPYVLMALEQGDGYASEETINLLLNFAIENKQVWQDTTWGVDAPAPMLRALYPYRENEIIMSLIDETVELIKDFQGENGSVGNASSTGLAISGLSAMGINPETVVYGEKSIIDGLMVQANDTLDGFLPPENSFSTEQGLRGLNAIMLFEKGEVIYNFKNNPLNTAAATVYTPPVYSGSGGGSVSINKDNKEEAEEKKNEEKKEEKIGLPDKHSDVVKQNIVYEGKTFYDVKDHVNEKAIISLAERGVINGRDNENYCPADLVTRAEFAAIVVRALGLPDTEKNVFKDVSDKDWFKNYVNGVSDTEFNPYGNITREEAATMILRAAKLCGMNTQVSDDGARNILSQFADYISVSDWAKNAMAFCYNENILDSGNIDIEPYVNATRSEMAQMIYNMLYKAELI